VRFRLLPSDEGFFVLFNEAAANVADCARTLRDLLAGENARGALDAVRTYERRGDELTRSILHRLNSTFVTPFDREDIHALAEELDDVVDDVLEIAYRSQMLPTSTPIPEVKNQADVLVQLADEVVALLARLESMKGVEPHLDAIDRLESEGDAIYRQALTRLFSGELEPLDVLRQKDIVEVLENALNTVEDISNVVESIVLKHA
jgi:predicted phosphate transport protein (TIGR00153 family)